ncbi:MAG TPA: UTP--glucose-1-phosphate uridylyltransferase, partial [Thermoflexales bacterium]|nr:UTP--glucose-1-phosphate uridylyltransferase [Thermoflexales bacterium]
LARTRRDAERHACDIPHLISTSYLTHDAIAAWQSKTGAAAILSPGRAIGQRFVPMARDLRFAYEEAPQQKLDAQAQKVREGAQAALIGWAQSTGEGSDYTDNVPSQCIHPVGHWFELPNLLRNGALAHVLGAHPNLRTLMLHNVDTLGANVDPAMLGRHLAGGAALTFEVIARQMEDRGGGLARVNGRARLVEGLAMPREDDEFLLSYYNSMTTWIDIDGLLAAFGLARADLRNPARVDEAIGAMAARLPTYITLKDVKKRWGHGQEDVYPVAQFEKLWSDMSALPDVACAYMVVPRSRGQQLKDIAQLDGWLRDGSAAHIEKLCGWSE